MRGGVSTGFRAPTPGQQNTLNVQTTIDPETLELVDSANVLPWCITLDNSKGISRLRFWCKNSRVNGINDLPVFMHQGIVVPDLVL